MLLLNVVLFLLPGFAVSAPGDDIGADNVDNNGMRNANHIFNAIHSSMRQFGSSWNHNGMSYFIATVPAHTEFYHGRGTADPVKGIEWLAFEPEHSLWFAGMGGPPPGGPGGPGKPGEQPDHQHPPPKMRKTNSRVERDAQTPLHSPKGDRPTKSDESPHLPHGFPERKPGYLHTYRTKHALSLLYIDGLSGAKSTIGPLDSQDFGLLNWATSSDEQPHSDRRSRDGHRRTQREPPHLGGPMDEQRRATELCAIAQEQWSSKIDGFIRMELGFEIILCDFERDLDVVDVLRTAGANDSLAHNPGFYNEQFQWYRSVAQRFDSIGSDRVTLDYDSFVTAFAYDDINLFPDGRDANPRMKQLSVADRLRIRHDVDAMVLGTGGSDTKPTNWQAVADMIVTRYGGAVPYLATLRDLTDLQSEIQLLMRPFIDFGTRNVTAEVARCASHFLPPSVPSNQSTWSTARRAVTSISHRICNTMFSTLYLPSSSSVDDATAAFVDLKTYLDWTTWRHCARLCSYQEVCFIPIWPLGTVADRERGMGFCRNATELNRNFWSSKGYWGMPGWGGPPRSPPSKGGRGE